MMRVSEAISLGSHLIPHQRNFQGCVFGMALAAVGSQKRAASAVHDHWPWLFDFQISEDVCGCQLGRTSLYLLGVHLSDIHVGFDWTVQRVAEQIGKVENELIYLLTKPRSVRVRYADFLRSRNLPFDEVSVLQDAIHAGKSGQVKELKRMEKLS
jgi:hypothetical protein